MDSGNFVLMEIEVEFEFDDGLVLLFVKFIVVEVSFE